MLFLLNSGFACLKALPSGKSLFNTPLTPSGRVFLPLHLGEITEKKAIINFCKTLEADDNFSIFI